MSADDHDLHALAGPFVLDAVAADERARFTAHLAGCAVCRDEVRELREAAALLGTAQAVRPRPELRGPTIRAACQTSQLGPVIARKEPVPRTGARSGRARPRAITIAVAAAAALAVATTISLGTKYADLRDGSSRPPAARTVEAVLDAPDAVMRTAPVSSGGMAIVVTSHREHMAVFLAHGLRALPHARSYELWLIGPRGDRPAGMLTVHHKGMAGPAVITGMRAGDMVGLTVEPASGSLRPTSAPVVLIGAAAR